MDEKEIKKRVELTIKIIKAITNDLNLPDTNTFYKFLLKNPIIEERISIKEQVR